MDKSQSFAPISSTFRRYTIQSIKILSIHKNVSQFNNASGGYSTNIFFTPRAASTKSESSSYFSLYKTLFIILSINAIIFPDLYESNVFHSFGISDEICFAVYVTKSVFKKFSRVGFISVYPKYFSASFQKSFIKSYFLISEMNLLSFNPPSVKITRTASSKEDVFVWQILLKIPIIIFSSLKFSISKS